MPVENLVNDEFRIFEEIAKTPSSSKNAPQAGTKTAIWFRQAQQNQQQLAIAYSVPPPVPPQQIWEQLSRHRQKYLSRTSKPVTRQQLGKKLRISDTSLELGLKTLTHLGFKVNYRNRAFHITRQPETGSAEKKSPNPY